MLNYGSGGTYGGFDRFGRVTDQKWEDAEGNTAIDWFRYGYDRNSNRKWREVNMPDIDGKDEYYNYDGLDRLKDYSRGDLTGSHPNYTGIDPGDPTRKEAWALDVLSNWSEYLVDGDADGYWDLEQERTHNAANEITGLAGANWVDPAYDASGNVTLGPRLGSESTAADGLLLVYDGWNRVTAVYEDDGATSGEIDGSDTQLAACAYDGMHRRIAKTVDPDGADTDYDYYYNESWQIVEVRKEGDVDPLKQYVWDIRYIDAAVVRFRDSDTSGSVDDTLYYCTDANMNVTALVSEAGTVVERYMYDAYGSVTVLDDDFDNDDNGVSDVDNVILYAGYRWDSETGLYSVRLRMYHPTLGRWVQRDPLVYSDTMNLYEYAVSNPLAQVDAFGLAACGCVCGGYGDGDDSDHPDWKDIPADVPQAKPVCWEICGPEDMELIAREQQQRRYLRYLEVQNARRNQVVKLAKKIGKVCSAKCGLKKKEDILKCRREAYRIARKLAGTYNRHRRSSFRWRGWTATGGYGCKHWQELVGRELQSLNLELFQLDRVGILDWRGHQHGWNAISIGKISGGDFSKYAFACSAFLDVWKGKSTGVYTPEEHEAPNYLGGVIHVDDGEWELSTRPIDENGRWRYPDVSRGVRTFGWSDVIKECEQKCRRYCKKK